VTTQLSVVVSLYQVSVTLLTGRVFALPKPYTR